jgi:uncharacterized Zn finger protein (UPF0148 family)
MDVNEEMIRLLFAKAKMLGYHCPVCKLPLFEKDKKIVCVRCGEVRVEREKNDGPPSDI